MADLGRGFPALLLPAGTLRRVALPLVKFRRDASRFIAVPTTATIPLWVAAHDAQGGWFPEFYSAAVAKLLFRGMVNWAFYKYRPYGFNCRVHASGRLHPFESGGHTRKSVHRISAVSVSLEDADAVHLAADVKAQR
jgi:hypothetical protein